MSMRTIAAIATPLGEGSIGVIRISGDNAIEIADKVFCSFSGKALCELKGYSALYGEIKDNDTVLDDAVALVFRAPKSYTGEDVVEISKILTTDAEVDGRDDKEVEIVTLKPQHYAIGTTLTVVADDTLQDATTEVEEATVKVDIPTIQVGDTVDLVPAEVLAEGQCTVDLETGEITFHADMDETEVHIFYNL